MNEEYTGLLILMLQLFYRSEIMSKLKKLEELVYIHLNTGKMVEH